LPKLPTPASYKRAVNTLLLGRATFELFSHIWPHRTDEFSSKMNAMPKYVVSRSLDQVEQRWNNAGLIEGDLIETVRRLKADRDLVVAGSISVVHALMQADLVDEYRPLVFPVVLGQGARLFEAGEGAALKLVDVQWAGAAALLTYRRQPRWNYADAPSFNERISSARQAARRARPALDGDRRRRPPGRGC
jgi:dihydrofolate reductase